MLQWWKNRVSFPAMPTEVQVQSVVLECVPSGHADTPLQSLSLGCWLHQLSQVWPVVGGCYAGLVSVQCAGFLSGTRGHFPVERRDAEDGITLSQLLRLSFCFSLPSSTSFREILTPNGSDVSHLL